MVKLTTNNLPLITIYPNPAKDVVVLNGEGMKTIAIIDNTGKTIKQLDQVTNNQSINVSTLSIGIYMIKIEMKDGSIATEKLVKE